MGYKLPVLTACCFCIPLRIGALIIGYWSVVFNLISLGGMVYTTYIRIQDYKLHTSLARIWIIVITQTFTITVYLILSVTLIVGVHKREPGYLRRYFIYGLVGFVVNVVIIAVGLFFYGGWRVVDYLIAFTSLIIYFYYLIVIRSAYLNMEEELKPRLRRKEYV